jgi:hypothetical protein
LGAEGCECPQVVLAKLKRSDAAFCPPLMCWLARQRVLSMMSHASFHAANHLWGLVTQRSRSQLAGFVHPADGASVVPRVRTQSCLLPSSLHSTTTSHAAIIMPRNLRTLLTTLAPWIGLNSGILTLQALPESRKTLVPKGQQPHHGASEVSEIVTPSIEIPA